MTSVGNESSVAERRSANVAVSGLKFLPPGVPIPEGVAPDGIPRPYDPSNPVAAIPNTQPERDLGEAALPAAFLDSLRSRRHQAAGWTKAFSSTTSPRVSNVQAYHYNASDGVYGLTPTAFTGVTLPVNTVNEEEVSALHDPGSSSCLAVGADADRPAGAITATTARFVAFIVCTGTGTGSYVEAMDATWQSKYARTYSGELKFISQVIHVSVTPNCWAVELFNFNLAAWETKKSLCANPVGSASANTSYDTFNMLSCPTLPTINVESLLFDYGGTWSGILSVGSTSSTDYCFTSGAYTLTATSALSWSAP
jgi:hypothetical protein